jgi:hypothetical protein
MNKPQGILGVAMALTLFLCTHATAGLLSGRIIQENGASLAKVKVVVEGQEFVTNDFGGYEVELKDGARQLNMVIDNTPYTSETISIFSPRTSQNWRMDVKAKKLIKIR